MDSPADRHLRRQLIRAEIRLREQQRRVEQRAGHVRDLRLFYVVIGGIVVFAGEGSWGAWLLGGGFALFFAWIAGRLPDHLYR